MTERHILFSGPMVRAILDGRKTQTRRAVKPQPNSVKNFGKLVPYRRAAPPREMPSATFERPIVCPYGVSGDRLWVREAHAIVPASAYRMSEGVHQIINPDDSCEAAVYREGWERSKPGKWRPSIHMPRWASRLTLEITDVRVERLNACSEADARAEGVFPAAVYGGEVKSWLPAEDRRERFYDTAVEAYAALWDAINGPKAWDENPWVWAVSFEVVR